MSNRAEWDSPDYEPKKRADETSQQILGSETSRRFHDLMDAAMLVSFFKYGAAGDAYPHKVDALASMKKRLQAYGETGNVEYLVDAANFLMLEFMFPKHPKAHYKATDKDGSTGRVASNKRIYKKANQFANKDLADESEVPLFGP
jgi:hypothetical protein